MAALLRWWVAPTLELLPTDYVAETTYTAKLWSPQTLLSAAEESESIVRRREQTLTSRDGHSIIQGDAHWLTTAGVVIFETLNLYGVDRFNETAGFESLPDVPEKYHALSYGKGRLWIEPVSGVVVDYEDEGTSYFVATKTQERVDETRAQWSARYTAETIQAQLQLAAAMRGRMRVLELWLPLTFSASGLVWIAA
jgi:hypothetical protein